MSDVRPNAMVPEEPEYDPAASDPARPFRDFFAQYERQPTPPALYAILDAQIIGKAVSSHPNQPVHVTLRVGLPDGGTHDIVLSFPGEDDAAHVPAMHDGEGGYAQPRAVKILIMAAPDPVQSIPAPAPDAVDADAMNGANRVDEDEPVEGVNNQGENDSPSDQNNA